MIFTVVKSARNEDLRPVAMELRRQRLALHLTLAEVAVRAQVSVGFLSMLERGRQTPSFDRLERVRAALGLSSPLLPHASPEATPGIGSRELLGARLAAGPASLAELSRITGGSVRGVQETLRDLGDQLQALGIRLITDGTEARLAPRADLAKAAFPFHQSPKVRSLSHDQYLALAVAAEYGALTRRQLDEIRGVDSHEILVGLVERGFLSSVVDTAAPGKPRVYRLTTQVLEVMGVSSVEDLREMLSAAMPRSG